jgi:Fur family ferric uptake transcriptional regulator
MKTRNTKAKSLILESLKRAPQAAVSQDVLQTELEGEVDRATIYRVLNRFKEEGVIHKIVGDDGKQYFAVCMNCGQKKHQHNHYHFRCLNCGRVECMSQQAPIDLPEGYQMTNFNGVVSGYCARCNQHMKA